MINARGITVLLVDDNPFVRQNLQRLLIGHPNINLVGQAGNREDALERVRILQPKVVLINIDMPGMDAVSTTREIRQRYPTVVVIGLNITAQQDEQSKRSKHQNDTAKRFRALGEPLLHAIWRSTDRGDSTLPPRELAC